MRSVLIVTALAAALLAGNRTAAAYEGPWCAVQIAGDDIVTENCGFRSFELCRREVIAGNRGFCRENPRWQGPQGEYREPRRRRRARRE